MQIRLKAFGLAAVTILGCVSILIDAQTVDAPASEASPLTRVVPFIEQTNAKRSSLVEIIGRSAGLPVRVEWGDSLNADAELDVHLNGCTVNAALLALLNRMPVMDVHEIVVDDILSAAHVYTHQYSIGDITPVISARPGEGADRLVSFLQAAIGNESWKDNGGTVGELGIVNDTLFVTHNLTSLQQVGRVLDLLRKPMPAAEDRVPAEEPAMLDRKLIDADFNQTPLRQIFAQLAKQTSANLVVSSSDLEAVGLDMDSPCRINLTGMKLGQGLRELLWSLGSKSLDYVFQNDVILIDTTGAMSKRTELRTYSLEPLVRRLMNPLALHNQPVPARKVSRQDSVDSIKEMIERAINPDMWRDSGGSFGDIFDLGDRLAVLQTPANQAQVAMLLSELTQQATTQPATAPTSSPPALPKIPATPVGDLDFDGTPLQDALDRIAFKSNLRIIVNWPALEDAGVRRETSVRFRLPDATVRSAIPVILAVVQGDTPLTGTIDADNVIHISTAADGAAPSSVRLYPIRSLIDAILRASVADPQTPQQRGAAEQDAVDSIWKLIEDHVDTESWKDNGGAVGTIRSFADVLVVTAAPETHVKIDTLLKNMRQEILKRNLPAGE